jgi:aminopeptidase-like protein
MLGLQNPPALQFSFDGTTEIDQCCRLAMADNAPQGWTAPFRRIIENDERQFNAPGVRIPMVSLSRVLPPDSPDWPYPEYHSSHDSPASASIKSLEEARDLVLQMLEILEHNIIPVNKFRGEIFCSRFGLNIDAAEDPAGHRTLMDALYLIDGTRSLADIAEAVGSSFSAVKNIIDRLYIRGLVDYTR